ncbi:peptidase M61 [Sphingobium jiangsuense]|uniref:Putative metalloprotease with PDZ domain n=1 Tax=Sphingobium jiangsuense TaxID=870476 RepID=A0A7W6FPK6_9SPHN|nr:M61 family metallopeptidase [Sphingobium jiangsuense]MBB3926186.1 putative metalloprotease with PDZ domain [Sphingobium jiangsuense]GLT02293.1 peptidase M61 [Sphingobium jiangsuense]
MHRSFLLPLLLSTAAFASPALHAQNAPQTAATRNSAPVMQPIVDTVPAPRDIPYPGTMSLTVDASDTMQNIWRVRQVIPVASAGPLTLLYPEWLPGKHGPRGQIDKLAGLVITANGKDIGWTRDPLDVYAFHVNVPQGAREIVAEFQFLNPTAANQGRIAVTPSMLNLQFETVSLYPAGYYARRIPVQATVTYPQGWTAFTALRGKQSGAAVRYDPTDYETLIDSPVFAGRHAKAIDLGNEVKLNMVADNPAELAATPEQIALHRKMVDEALALFGARHFDYYDFLLAITSELGGIGLEHHRSSENAVDPGYFTRWNDGPGDRNLLPHEFVHSWNGKFRRPELLWTPDYRTPMQDTLLWVYEGQTQFWGYVLGARSGLYTKEQTLDALASIAARLDTAKGRQWRPMVDTTLDPIISARRPKGWASWQRSEDYYNEGLLMWLEADAIIRRNSQGARGLDDFARAFFGVRPGDWGQLTYSRQDVIDTLNSVQPYDWAAFFAAHVDRPTLEAPKAGFDMGGYTLVYGDTPNSTTREVEKNLKGVDQSYGVGLVVKNEGEITGVIWDSAAFKAGLAVGMSIVAINGAEFSGEQFRAALMQARATGKPMELVVRQGKLYRNISLDYSLGLRYPRLRKTGEGEGSLDRLLQPKT